MTHPTPLQRIAFWIGWTLRGIPVLLFLAGCAHAGEPRRACRFNVAVTVLFDTALADAECRMRGVKWSDNGESIKDTDTVRGCAPVGEIITNGTESNMGHEMAHQVERNCK